MNSETATTARTLINNTMGNIAECSASAAPQQIACVKNVLLLFHSHTHTHTFRKKVQLTQHWQ
jgi:hypothetical protein